MITAILKLTFLIHDCHSLKEKRKIVKSLISRIRNNFNASVAETGHNDAHGKIEIGVSMIGNDKRLLNSKADKVIDLAEKFHPAELFDSEIEIINL
jgi:hypothetical protein